MVEQVKIGIPTLIRHARPATIRIAAMAPQLAGFWRFNRMDGETDEEAAERCSWNMAPGASNGDVDRRWPGGAPAFFPGYARFRNDRPLHSNIPDFGPAGGCLFAVARTLDTTTGSTSNHRAFIAGTYAGTTTSRGFGMEFASWPAGTVRALDYPASGAVQTNQATTAAADLGEWRVWYAETGRVAGSNAALAIVNLVPGDGSTADPTDTSLTGGRATGAQTLAIGGRITDSTGNYVAEVHKDIAFLAAFAGLPDLTQRAAIAAQLVVAASRASLTMGAV